MKCVLGIILVFLSIPLLYANTCVDFFSQKTGDLLSKRETLQKIFKMQTEEISLVPDPEHRSTIRLHRDSSGQQLVTEKVVLIFHGLLNSPKWMKSIEEFSFNSGYNVLNIRLENHQESNRYALDDVTYQQWLIQSDRVFQIAKELGKEVVVVGHSTGGVLAASLAFSRPTLIHKVFLLAPALKVNRTLSLALRVTTFLGITGRHLELLLQRKLKKYLSSFAGIQVMKLGNWYAQGLQKSSPRDLGKLHFSIVDSELDNVIDPKANEKFSNLLKSYPENFEVTYRKISASWKIKHDEIPQNNTPAQEVFVLEPLRELLSN